MFTRYAMRGMALLADLTNVSVDVSQIISVQEMRSQMREHWQSQKREGAWATEPPQPAAMHDSFSRVCLAFGSNPSLRRDYASHSTVAPIRFGLILEDLDVFAVYIGYLHNQGPGFGISDVKGNLSRLDVNPQHPRMGIVTACVDRIDLQTSSQQLRNSEKAYDTIFEGHVTWVGRSSMEVTLRFLHNTEPPDLWTCLFEARVVLVATGSDGKSMKVRPLKVETEDEQSLFRVGEANAKRRKLGKDVTLHKSPPSVEETAVIHSMFTTILGQGSLATKHKTLPEGHVWMEECRLANLLICFPQESNIYGKIFGGFLMRKAVELAWATGSMFAKSRLGAISIDDINFRKPVEIGSVLHLQADVCYTKGPCMSVRVQADVCHIETGERETTNTFHFLFFQSEFKNLPKVVPKSYAEGMLYLNGKRHHDHCLTVKIADAYPAKEATSAK